MGAALVSVLFAGGCGQDADRSVSAPGAVGANQPGASMSDGGDLPAGVPAFTRHFTDPMYDDEAGEFAPFGSDEGWELLFVWDGRRDELTDETTVADILEGSGYGWVEQELDVPEGGGIPGPGGQTDAATIAVGAAFTLLRLTGHIDAPGRDLALRSLDILNHRHDSPPELRRQQADLEAWQG